MTALRLPRGLLLDLDGTLIDSAPDLADALSLVLATHDRAPLCEDTVRRLVGHGVGKLVEGAFARTGPALSAPALAEATAAMARAYEERLTNRTRLLPGVRDLVAHCGSRGIRLACVTNKPRAMAQAILDHFALSRSIRVVIGGDGHLPRKPAPDPLLAAAAELGLEREDVWMVGDGLPDLHAARAAGITAIAVESRYGEPFDSASEALLGVAGLAALRDLLDHLGEMVD